VRAVLDTNVVVSALLWGGTPELILQRARAGELQLATSPALIAELSGILNRRKFAAKLAQSNSSPAEVVALYTQLAHTIEADAPAPSALRDPDDAAVLAEVHECTPCVGESKSVPGLGGRKTNLRGRPEREHRGVCVVCHARTDEGSGYRIRAAAVFHGRRSCRHARRASPVRARAPTPRPPTSAPQIVELAFRRSEPENPDSRGRRDRGSHRGRLGTVFKAPCPLSDLMFTVSSSFRRTNPSLKNGLSHDVQVRH